MTNASQNHLSKIAIFTHISIVKNAKTGMSKMKIYTLSTYSEIPKLSSKIFSKNYKVTIQNGTGNYSAKKQSLKKIRAFLTKATMYAKNVTIKITTSKTAYVLKILLALSQTALYIAHFLNVKNAKMALN